MINRLASFNDINLDDLNLNDIANLPLLAQGLVAFGLGIVIFVLGYTPYLMPKLEQLDRLKLKEQALKVTYQSQAKQIVGLPLQQANLKRLNRQYRYFLSSLPKQKQLLNTLMTINAQSEQLALNMTRIDWGEKQEHTFFERLPLHIELTGDYHAIGHFSQKVAELPQLIVFDSASWTRINPTSQELQFRAQASHYQFKIEEEK